jgi:hypothetical protein
MVSPESARPGSDQSSQRPNPLDRVLSRGQADDDGQFRQYGQDLGRAFWLQGKKGGFAGLIRKKPRPGKPILLTSPLQEKSDEYLN